MRAIEPLILDAWKRLGPKILSDPAELQRRLARMSGRSLSRPPRAWCLAVKATDKRIGVVNARIDPEYATDPHDPDHLGRVVEHTVKLTGWFVRELARPVYLEPPGELWNHVARKLGVNREGLRHARATEKLRSHYIRGLMGRPGRAVPTLYSPDGLDPGARSGFAAPDPLWLGIEWVTARMPVDFEQTLTRVPVYRSITHKHQYDEAAHPEAAEKPRRGPGPRMPPPNLTTSGTSGASRGSIWETIPGAGGRNRMIPAMHGVGPQTTPPPERTRDGADRTAARVRSAASRVRWARGVREHANQASRRGRCCFTGGGGNVPNAPSWCGQSTVPCRRGVPLKMC